MASAKPKYLNARLFVANIVSKEITKDDLSKHFEKYGNVVGEYYLIDFVKKKLLYIILLFKIEMKYFNC